MSESKVYLKEGFFKFLVSMEMLKDKKEKLIFLSSLGLADEEFEEFKIFLSTFNVEIECDEEYIYPLKVLNKFHLDLNLSEWFSLQIKMKEEKESTDYSYKVLKNKIEELNREHHKFNLFKKLKKISSQRVAQIRIDRESIIRRAEYFAIKRSVVKLTFENQKQCDVFPMRLVFLDGILSYIVENVEDKTLGYFAVSDIVSLEEVSSEYVAHISQIEVNDFISNIRLINGNEERLILKIFSPGDMDLLPKNHFLGNPFVTSNGEGDMIWAASIEMCEDVYNWLYQMKDHVEVLDPGHIKKEFAHFCELKKESLDTKKVG